MNPTRRHQLRPNIDQLEARDVPAAFLSSAWTAPDTSAIAVMRTDALAVRSDNSLFTASDLGAAVAAYAAAHLGERVGGGECAHLAVEALRDAGAKFSWIHGPTGDYAWGMLVAKVTGTARGAVFSNATATFRPGDVIQYRNAVFSDGTWATHHTAIVAAVDSAGQVTSVYQQNFNGIRGVTEQPLDLSLLTHGRVRVYRAVPRTRPAGQYGFTVVNNASAPVRVVERSGGAAAAYQLSAADTLRSFQVRGWTTVGGSRLMIAVGSTVLQVTDRLAYEVIDGPDGPAIRAL